MGGILHDLMAGNPDRARARASLLLACADQASIDGGSWVVSTVALMEPLPPYQEFAKHTQPSPSESQSSALFDPRWSEVFPGTLKERESYNEAKKKLQGGRQLGNGKGEDPPGGQGQKRWLIGRQAREVMNFSAEEAGSWDRAFDPLASSIQGPTFSEFRSERGEGFEKGTSPGRPGEVPIPFDRHVPGSSVEPLDPKHVLRSLVSEIFRGPQLNPFAKSCLRKAEPGEASGGDFRRPRDGAWPMPVPVPYPGIFRKNALSLCKDELKKLVVNAQVILLNYFDLGRPTRAPAACREGL